MLRRLNSRGSRFNADDCKKKEEEADRPQDGRQEARTQSSEKEEGETEVQAEIQKVANLSPRS